MKQYQIEYKCKSIHKTSPPSEYPLINCKYSCLFNIEVDDDFGDEQYWLSDTTIPKKIGKIWAFDMIVLESDPCPSYVLSRLTPDQIKKTIIGGNIQLAYNEGFDFSDGSIVQFDTSMYPYIKLTINAKEVNLSLQPNSEFKGK